MRFIVIWVNRPDYHAGEPFVPLEMHGQFGSHYWYRDYEKAAADQLQLCPIPANLYTQTGPGAPGAEVSARWGGCVVNAPTLAELQVMIAGLRWDEGPTAMSKV
jgi:hypothetical protein